MQIVHPFHPQSGLEFELVSRRLHWGEDRVAYASSNGELRSIASNLTNVDPPDEFRRVAGGSAAFRTVDLLALAKLLDRRHAGNGSEGA